jgi:hypothetical protein
MSTSTQLLKDGIETTRPMLRMDVSIFDVGMMQKRRRPLGERAGQSSDCPSELIQILNYKVNKKSL